MATISAQQAAIIPTAAGLKGRKETASYQPGLGAGSERAVCADVWDGKMIEDGTEVTDAVVAVKLVSSLCKAWPGVRDSASVFEVSDGSEAERVWVIKTVTGDSMSGLLEEAEALTTEVLMTISAGADEMANVTVTAS